MTWYQGIVDESTRRGVHETPQRFTAGHAVGIIAVDLVYPKLPGNVANACTYPFPVLFRKVSFPIEKLFAGDASIREQIIAAAVELEQEGVRAIIGACGYFAHFQKDVAEAVNIPVFLSSLCQLPLIKTALSAQKKIAVLAASGENINDELLEKVGTDSNRLIICNVGNMESFAPIRHGGICLDNGKLEDDLCHVVQKLIEEHGDIGSILLECSDLPPYAAAIQAVSGLPVYDFNTMIELVHRSVVQRPYYGYF
ncbi:MAG: aspartate/glutamate racemase family protein [Lachnospira sp.]|nr:aspartate/glutamate racemase family protein [Lachnospira sp.]